MAKTAVFGVIHLAIAFSVTYALTGNVWAASAVTLVEPAVNMVAHYFFDKWWGDPAVAARFQAWAARVGWRQGQGGEDPRAPVVVA